MAVFTTDEWRRIRARLEAEPAGFGLPERVYGSALLGSFNIRKLGSATGRNADTWQFLADICRRFDLLAVQEIMDDLGGLRKLLDLMGPEFGMIVSDKTGVFPGEPGVGERLGFIFNWSVVHRGEVVTDLSYDRSKVLGTIALSNDQIHEAMAPYAEKLQTYLLDLQRYEAGERETKPRKPSFRVKMPVFLTFIRTPFCVSFRITGHPGRDPFELMAVNAHLYFGNYMSDRRQEFDALFDWIMNRVKERQRAYHPNFLLLGDLNLDFDSPEADRGRIEEKIKSFNATCGDDVHVNFPFLDVHKGRTEVFKTNARLSETFDQIAFFGPGRWFPGYEANTTVGDDPLGPDYGVFDFVSLFCQALHGRELDDLSDDERKEFLARFEHKVSDHMPLWVRLPLP